MQTLFSLLSVCGLVIFLIIYALIVISLFTTDKLGRRRRWVPIDLVWVPLDGLTGLCLLVVWWKMHLS